MTKLQIKTSPVFEPLLAKSRYKAAHGGRACVHKDTLLDTPSGQVKIKDFQGGEVYSHCNGRIITAKAEKPVEYPEEDLYRVVLKDGREIIATDEHKFLTNRGWVQLQHLSMYDALFCAPCPNPSILPHSISDTFLLKLPEGVRHCWGKLEDYLYRYWQDFRQYGLRPLLSLDSVPTFSPFLVDEGRHNLHASIYLDDMENLDNNTPLRFSPHHSSYYAPLFFQGRNYANQENCSGGRPSGLFSALYSASPQSLLYKTRCLLDKLSTLISQDLYIFRNLVEIHQITLSRLIFGVRDKSYSDPHGKNVSLIGIDSICKHSRQNYWDLHVPVYNNYLSSGIVNHNSGKSHFFAELGIERCITNPGTRIVCVREVQKSLKESVKLLLEDKIKTMGVGAQFKVQYDSILAPGGGVIIFQGLIDHTAESIKSLEGFDIGYAEEAQTLTAHSLELFIPTIIRKPGSELWFSWNPRDKTDPVDLMFRGANPPKESVVVEANWRDNTFFTEESESVRIQDQLTKPDRYNHIWEGDYEPQAVGAIWTRDVIERNRVAKAPNMSRILIGVDPPTESGEESDKCGLIGAGRGADGRGYVLADESKKGTPEEWGRAAVALYDLLEADAIVVEVNQGGDMVRSVIHSIRPSIRVIKVRAKRGKHLRAEPVSALYSLNRVSHVGNFPELERQMCLTTAEGYEGNDSPDNMDAMVYIFLQLFTKLTKKQVPDSLRPNRASNSYRPHDGLTRGARR